jgi:flagellar biosynthesis regulator FlbT
MNNLKANPKGLDVLIYGVQNKLYNGLINLWNGIELTGYDRCYLANRNGFKSIDYYVSANEYQNLVVAEENKFFFTAENDIEKVGNLYYKTTIDLYFILNVNEIKPNIIHRADEEVRQDVLNVIEKIGQVEVLNVVTNIDKIFNRFDFNYLQDVQPYHIFKIELDTHKYHLNQKLCST